jgi:hypothetical protein
MMGWSPCADDSPNGTVSLVDQLVQLKLTADQIKY